MADRYTIAPGSALAPGGAAEVGNKAWNLMRMARAGLPVPPGFVLTTGWSARRAPDEDPALRAALVAGIAEVEAVSGLGFGAVRRPLLVSVRSGAAVSMPGMMETVLDVGLNATTVEGLVNLTGNPRLAWDSFRRLVQGFFEVVAGQDTAPFDALIAAALVTAEVESETDLDFLSLRSLTRDLLDCYRDGVGSPFPTDPHEQLHAATTAVFRSWDAPKAVSYRRLNKLDDAAGTAVTVQTMVYGNAGQNSGAGVGFTRNPATGGREFYYDFRFNAQGEDVVAGRQALRDNDRLRTDLPAIWTRLDAICRDLETLFGDAQDFEFTVQQGVLSLLQARRAKRTEWAALSIAVDLVAEGLLTPAAALRTLDGIDPEHVVRTSFAPPLPALLAQAEVASLGVASGAVALDSGAVQRFHAAGQAAILVRHDTVTSDIEGMALAVGILTATGGRTSHAAVVARQLGKVCLVGCPTLEIDLALRSCRIGGTLLHEGDAIALDGNGGGVFAGTLAPLTERPDALLATIAGWRGKAAA